MVKASDVVLPVLQARICRKALKRRLRGGFGWDFYRLRYEDVDPFYCPPTDKTVIDRIRKFLIEKKMLLSYVEGKSSPLFRYYEEAIVKNGLVMNFYLA